MTPEHKPLSARLTTLNSITQALNALMEPDDLLPRTLAALEQVVDFSLAGLYLYDEAEDRLSLIATKGFTPEQQALAERTAAERHPGWVVRHKQPLLSQNAATEPRVRYVREQPRGRSHLYVPMLSQDRCVGAIGLAHTQLGAFDDDDLAILTLYASQVAVALENARLYQQRQAQVQELEERAHRLEALNQISLLVNSHLNMDSILQMAVIEITQLCRASQTLLFIFSADKRQAIVRAIHPRPSNPPALTVEAAQSWFTRHLLILDRSSMTRSPRTDPVWELAGLVEPPALALSIPLSAGKSSLGAVVLTADQVKVTFSAKDVELVETIAHQLALSIEKHRLLQESLNWAAMLQQRASRLALLNRLSEALGATLDWRHILQIAVDHMVRALGLDQAGIALLDEQKQCLHVEAEHLSMGPLGREIPLQDNPLLQKALESGQPVVVESGPSNSVPPDVQRTPILRDARSHMIVPLVAQGRVIGAVGLGMTTRPRSFGDEEIELAQIIARQTATALQNAQHYQAAVEKQQHLSHQIESANDVIFNIDLQGRFTLFNRMAEHVSGYTRHEILGRPFTDLLCAEYHAPMLHLLQERPSGDVLRQMHQIEFVHKKGQRVPLEMTIAPLGNDSERAGAQVIARDIRERKELERMKEDFIATVTHELRTPLSSIMGFGEVLLSGSPGPLTATQQEFIDIIFQDSQRLLELVNDLLQVSRLEAGRSDLALEPAKLEDLIPSIVESLRPVADKQSIALTLEPLTPLPPIRADGRRIKQVLNNLVSNAIKFTPSGGSVTVSACQTDDDWLRVTVRDTGIGIAPEDLPHLFDRFYRTDQVRRQAIKGTGLGLYISKAIVEGHGGQMGVQSTPGEGSAFWFSLPVTARPEP